MNVKRSVLGHVSLLMLTDRLEDIAVEALGYILSNSEDARIALQEFVRDGGANIDSLAEVQTQDVGTGLERPDIAFRNAQKVEHLLIEAKFGAVLTENQPLGYLKRPPHDKQVVLLFVAPERRIDSLWQELTQRVNDSEKFSAEELNALDELRSARVSGHRILMLTGWRTLLGRIAARLAPDLPIAEDIRQLQGLVDEEDYRAYQPMPEILSIDDQERLPQLERLVYDVIESGKAYGWADTTGFNATRWDGGYVRYFSIAGIPAWFGTDYQLWQKFNSPLWFGFQQVSWATIEELRDRLEPVKEKYCSDYLSNEPYYTRNEDFVRISLPAGVEHAEAVAAIERQLRTISDLLG